SRFFSVYSGILILYVFKLSSVTNRAMLKDSLGRCRGSCEGRSIRIAVGGKAHSPSCGGQAEMSPRKGRRAAQTCLRQAGSALGYRAGRRNYTEEGAMTMTRRELCLLLPAATLAGGAAFAEAGEQDASLPSGGYSFETLEVKTAPSGAKTREIFKGKLATGESIET